MLIGIFDPMGAQTERLRCEVCQNLILSPMNTGLLRYAVATAPTVYGIETSRIVLELSLAYPKVATAPTVYGIETFRILVYSILLQVATAPTVYGIETTLIQRRTHLKFFKLQQHLPFTVLKLSGSQIKFYHILIVATAPTVYGIETFIIKFF